jgi:hypothetical protein
MPRRVRIELDVVLDLHALGVRRELGPQVLVERDGIERIAHVDPLPHVRRDGEPALAGELLDVVLDLLDAERGADGDEQGDVLVGELGVHQHAVGDHCPLAVRHDDERTVAGAQALLERVEHPRALGLVDEEVVHVAQEHLRHVPRQPLTHRLGQEVEDLRLQRRGAVALRLDPAHVLALLAIQVIGAPGELRLVHERSLAQHLARDGAQPRRVAPAGGARTAAGLRQLVDLRPLDGLELLRRIPVLAHRARRELARRRVLRPVGVVAAEAHVVDGDRIPLAIHPVRHAAALTEVELEQRLVPLCLEHRGGGLVADAVHVDDRRRAAGR